MVILQQSKMQWTTGKSNATDNSTKSITKKYWEKLEPRTNHKRKLIFRK